MIAPLIVLSLIELALIWHIVILRCVQGTYRRCHEKNSNVSNYVFFTLLHEWVDKGWMHQLEKQLCVIPISSLEVYYWSFSN